MHIGLVCSEYPPIAHGGIGTFSRDLAEGLASVGHKVTVVGVYLPWQGNLELPKEELINGVTVIRLPSIKHLPNRLGMIADRMRLTLWLRAYHRRYAFDLVESPENSGWLVFGAVSGAPLVLRFHGSQTYLDYELGRPPSRMLHVLERLSISRADHLIAVSDYVGRRTMDLIQSTRDYRVIYNAVDAARFSPSSLTEVQSNLIVFVGAIDAKKGVVELVGAMNSVWKLYPDATLIMIGKDGRDRTNERNMSDYLRSLVNPIRVDQLIFVGRVPQPETAHFLRRAHVCCYPSHAESMPLVVLEAMAIGKPVVFMDTGPGPEIIEHGVSGLLCNTRSPQDIADNLIAILSNQDLAFSLGHNARNRVLDCFERLNWISQNVKLYEQICRKDKI